MKKTLRLTSLALVLMMVLTLTSCVPGTSAKAKEKLEKKEYTVVEVTGTAATTAWKLLGVDGVTASITATKSGELVKALYFEKAADAKAAMEKVEKQAKDESKDSSIKRSGKVVYFGTEQAMKDFN